MVTWSPLFVTRDMSSYNTLRKLKDRQDLDSKESSKRDYDEICWVLAS